MNLPVSLFDKSSYHVLAEFVAPEQIAPEIGQVLDAIYEVSQLARPLTFESEPDDAPNAEV